jgi:hypothetical protein
LKNFIADSIELYPIGTNYNPQFAEQNFYFMTTANISVDTMFKKIEKYGKLGWWEYYFSKEVRYPHSMRLSMKKDSIFSEFIVPEYFKRFGKEPYFFMEPKQVIGMRDTAFIITSFSSSILVYSLKKNSIIDSFQVETERRVRPKPILKIDSINLHRYKDSLNSSDYGGINGFFYDLEKNNFILIVVHDREKNKKRKSFSILTYNKELQKVDERVVDEELFYSRSVYSQEYGLLIPKTNEEGTSLIYRFSDPID